MSVMSLLHTKPFSGHEIDKTVKKLLGSKVATQAEIDEALKSHPANPANIVNATSTTTPPAAVPLATPAPSATPANVSATQSATQSAVPTAQPAAQSDPKAEILRKLAAKEISIEIASAMLTAIESKQPTGIYCKVSEKGGFSVYGINNRMPVTLYAEQWERLLAQAEVIRDCIAKNVNHPAVKANRDVYAAKKAGSKKS